MNQLVAILNRSSLAIQLLLLNTLTRHQLARVILASYPYVPRAAPIIEAAVGDLLPSIWQQEDGEDAAGAAAAAAASKHHQMSWLHSQERATMLQQQCIRWWQQDNTAMHV